MSSHEHDVRAALRRVLGQAQGPAPSSTEAQEVVDLWHRLEDPGPLAIPPEFAQQVLARLPHEAADDGPVGFEALFRAPSLVRGLAAAALVAGVALGVGFGTWVQPAEATRAEVAVAGAEWVGGSTLAESWFGLSEEGS